MRVGPHGAAGWLGRTVTLRPWRDADERIIGVIGVAVTVHELKNSVEELRVANERLSSHMDNSPLLVIDLDASLNITRCSARSQQVFGQAPAELLWPQRAGATQRSARRCAAELFSNACSAETNSAITLPRPSTRRRIVAALPNGSIRH